MTLLRSATTVDLLKETTIALLPHHPNHPHLPILCPRPNQPTFHHHNHRLVPASDVRWRFRRRRGPLATARARQPMQHDDPRPGRKHVLRRRDGLYQARQTGDARARRGRKARRRVDVARRAVRLAHPSRPPSGARQRVAQEEHHPIPRVSCFPPPLFFLSLALTTSG